MPSSTHSPFPRHHHPHTHHRSLPIGAPPTYLQPPHPHPYHAQPPPPPLQHHSPEPHPVCYTTYSAAPPRIFHVQSFPNPFKIDQKSLRMILGRSGRFQNGRGGVLRASWEASWAALGRFSVPLGRSSVVPGPS